MTNIDFNTADTQDSAFALIPANTLAKVYLTIRPGGAGPEGGPPHSKTSEAPHLNTEAGEAGAGPRPAAVSTPASAYAVAMAATAVRTPMPTAAGP